jgi:hypothetical protein
MDEILEFIRKQQLFKEWSDGKVSVNEYNQYTTSRGKNHKIDIPVIQMGQFTIPGRGRVHRESCGVIKTVYATRSGDAVAQRDYCYMKECPVCWGEWKKRLVRESSAKLSGLRWLTGSKLRHKVWTVKEPKEGWKGDKSDFGLDLMKRYLEKWSLNKLTVGWVYCLHPYHLVGECIVCHRIYTKDEDNKMREFCDCKGKIKCRWEYAPHVHLITDSFEDNQDVHRRAWLSARGANISNLSAKWSGKKYLCNRKQLANLLNYELGHCLVINSQQTQGLVWCGAFAHINWSTEVVAEKALQVVNEKKEAFVGRLFFEDEDSGLINVTSEVEYQTTFKKTGGLKLKPSDSLYGENGWPIDVKTNPANWKAAWDVGNKPKLWFKIDRYWRIRFRTDTKLYQKLLQSDKYGYKLGDQNAKKKWKKLLSTENPSAVVRLRYDESSAD